MQTYYPESVKAQVIAAYQMGTPKARIARELGIPRGTVMTWLSSVEPMPTVIDSEKQVDLGEMVFEYLAAGLKALTAQALIAADPEYIRAQPADALYLLHGTMADKLISVFGAIEAGSTEPDGSALEVHGSAVVS